MKSIEWVEENNGFALRFSVEGSCEGEEVGWVNRKFESWISPPNGYDQSRCIGTHQSFDEAKSAVLEYLKSLYQRRLDLIGELERHVVVDRREWVQFNAELLQLRDGDCVCGEVYFMGDNHWWGKCGDYIKGFLDIEDAKRWVVRWGKRGRNDRAREVD